MIYISSQYGLANVHSLILDNPYLLHASVTAAMVSAMCDLRSRVVSVNLITGVFICAITAGTFSALLEYTELPDKSGAFIGALTGFVGADNLKIIVRRLVFNKFGMGK